MLDELIRGGHPVAGLAGMAQLSARLLAAAATLAAGPLAPQRIRRGRFAAVVAVFGQARLQLLDLGNQLLDLADQRHIVRPQRVVVGAQRGDFFCWRHASTLHLLGKSG